MWKSACVGIHQLLNWKMHGETLKFESHQIGSCSFSILNQHWMLSEILLLAFSNQMDDIITVVPATSGLRGVITKTRESGQPRGNSMLYLLTRCSRILLEKLTGSQLVKKFPAFYWARRFITAFTNARHLSLSWATLIKSMTCPSHFLKINLNTLRTGAFKLFKCTFPGSKQFKSTFILCFFKYL